MKNPKLIVLMLVVFIKTSLFAQINFTKLPNQPPDNIISIITDPTNNDIYAAASIKVIKSTDAGTSYTLTANTGVGNLNVLYFTPSGVLYAGVDKSNTNSIGLIKYNKITNIWSEVLGAPQDITAIVEDNSGNLIVGTGTTGNYGATNPINKSTGMFYYTVANSTWTSINSGLPNVPTYTVFPFIKSLLKTPAGLIIAGTYGNGILKFNGTTWSSYGTGLSNLNVNSLAINSAGQVFAGTDVGVSSVVNATSAWSNSSSGLPTNKPVRTLSINASGMIFVGLGFYHYQNGNMAGDIYASSNNGSSWQNTATGYIGGVVYSILAHSSGNIVLGSAGIWKSTNNGGLWSYAMSGVSLANQTVKMVKNSLGHIFVLCRNNLLGTRLPFGGVFRSTDNGITWAQVVDGIKAQDLTEIFIDSQDNIWVAGNTQKANANGSGTIWGTPELYKSSNNGTTWVKNTSIVVASDSYNDIKETISGKLYVASSFGNGETNLSSTTDFNTFDNTLNLPPNNGAHSFGLEVNNANDVFQGTEIKGVMRSTSNGAAGSFSSITIGGNVTVFVDPISQNVYSSAGNVLTTGINFYCSNNNGNSFFPILNFPTYWANTADMAFTNTGKIYTAVNSSHLNQTGLYLMQSPVTTNSAFTQLISFGTLSFYFDTLFIDKCGYMYGVARGNGIAISNTRVNTPRQIVLSIPANNATNVSVTPTLTWNSSCDADTYRVQVATSNTFTTTVIDQAAIVGNTYVVPSGILNTNTTYYWRVIATNSVGIGIWSSTFNFTTLLAPCSITTTYSNGNWSNGLPILTQKAVITSNFTATADLSACTLDITNNAVVNVPSGLNFIISGAVTVAPTANLTFQNNANLLQTSNTSNIGNITIKRNSATLMRLDYTLWSSPVSGQVLQSFSPLTMASRFYTYNPVSNLYQMVATPAATNFTLATGYLIRMPDNHPTIPTIWNGTFTGNPNNGTVTIPTAIGTYNAIGNPYPSTLSANSFITLNNISEALYFWRKTNNTNNTSYATYTLAGGVSNSGSDPLNLKPNGSIAIGQGFIAKATSTNLSFTNAMRTTSNSAPFLKTTTNTNRIWLNLTNSSDVFCQTLIAYLPEATLGIDAAIDGRFFNDSQTALTSIISNEEFSIQGRPMPFDTNDIVSLGFKSEFTGNFTISLSGFDGLFTGNQPVFLKDNLTNMIQDLKNGDYTFATTIGVFNSRFELLFQNPLAITSQIFSSNSVIIYKQNQEIVINSGNIIMSNIKVFDVTGHLLLEKSNINATETKIVKDNSNEVLIITITSKTNQKITKKWVAFK